MRVSIIPPETKEGQPTMTQGTKIILEDGSELEGVTKVVLSAEPSDIWRAEIHCAPKMLAMHGIEAVFISNQEPEVEDAGL